MYLTIDNKKILLSIDKGSVIKKSTYDFFKNNHNID